MSNQGDHQRARFWPVVQMTLDQMKNLSVSLLHQEQLWIGPNGSSQEIEAMRRAEVEGAISYCRENQTWIFLIAGDAAMKFDEVPDWLDSLPLMRALRRRLAALER